MPIKSCFIKYCTYLLLLLTGFVVQGQCPMDGRSYEVHAKEDLLYAVDTAFDGTLDSLYLDIYTPVGDANPARPMIVWIHGGGFFRGNKEYFRDLCKQFAAEGFACSTISYRLGFYPPQIGNTSPPFSYDDAEPIRAGYRAMQDTKAAIRFLKARHAEDSTDIDHFILSGASAGGIAAVTAANIIHPQDKYDACKDLEPVKGLDASYERPDLGPVEGKFNLNGYDAKVEAVISIFGGIINTDFLGSSYPKHYFLYHQTLDPIVPCETHNGYWLAPVLKDNYPKISGGCSMLDYFDQHGSDGKVIMPFIVEGVEHGVHDMEALLDSIHVFLGQVLCQTTAVENADPIVGSIRVFPQPAQTWARVILPDGVAIKSVELVGLHAAHYTPAYETGMSNSEVLIDVSSLPEGFYILKITDNTANTYVTKLVK